MYLSSNFRVKYVQFFMPEPFRKMIILYDFLRKGFGKLLYPVRKNIFVTSAPNYAFHLRTRSSFQNHKIKYKIKEILRFQCVFVCWNYSVVSFRILSKVSSAWSNIPFLFIRLYFSELILIFVSSVPGTEGSF